MFDPLDFLSGAEKPPVCLGNQMSSISSENTVTVIQSREDASLEGELVEDTDTPIDVLDLPHVSIAPPMVVLTVLLLLRPSMNVNFSERDDTIDQSVESVCHEKGIAISQLEESATWCSSFGLSALDTPEKFCARVPRLASAAGEKDLLMYYTMVLSKYEKMQTTDQVNERILKEASMRISEKCGRTAQPAMNRIFEIGGLRSGVKLHEPALTSDNLGLKTWGASLVLARKLCENFPKFEQQKDLHILELGAGTGLVGISLALKILESNSNQNHTLYLTDLPEIVTNLKENVQINCCNAKPNLKVYADVLDWTNPKSFEEKYGTRKFDVLLVADPIYSPQHPQWIVDMISRYISPQGVLYLEVPIRQKYNNERQRLWSLLQSSSLQVVKEEVDEGVDDWGKVSYLYKKIAPAHIS
ncbi:LAQU0S02e05886g1_1 [Lachancea quebecensis]|uniref:LAQU0S02e05886g1_1 n=1 Tax=Lachancea quebecensis TaxID=1654605 RepID=A0A0P1KWA6_9SACH|nr:LAQU0S02e05886g1_1 [Lachancea quebecensis]